MPRAIIESSVDLPHRIPRICPNADPCRTERACQSRVRQAAAAGRPRRDTAGEVVCINADFGHSGKNRSFIDGVTEPVNHTAAEQFGTDRNTERTAGRKNGSTRAHAGELAIVAFLPIRPPSRMATTSAETLLPSSLPSPERLMSTPSPMAASRPTTSTLRPTTRSTLPMRDGAPACMPTEKRLLSCVAVRSANRGTEESLPENEVRAHDGVTSSAPPRGGLP